MCSNLTFYTDLFITPLVFFGSEAFLNTKYQCEQVEVLTSHASGKEVLQNVHLPPINTPNKLRSSLLPSNTGEQVAGGSLSLSLSVSLILYLSINYNFYFSFCRLLLPRIVFLLWTGCGDKMNAVQVISVTLLSILAANAQVIKPGRCPRPAVQQKFDAARVNTKPFYSL